MSLFAGSFVQLNGAALNVNDGFAEADVMVQSRDEAVLALLFPKKGVCEVVKIYGLDGPHSQILDYGNATVGKGKYFYSFERAEFLTSTGSI